MEGAKAEWELKHKWKEKRKLEQKAWQEKSMEETTQLERGSKSGWIKEAAEIMRQIREE